MIQKPTEEEFLDFIKMSPTEYVELEAKYVAKWALQWYDHKANGLAKQAVAWEQTAKAFNKSSDTLSKEKEALEKKVKDLEYRLSEKLKDYEALEAVAEEVVKHHSYKVLKNSDNLSTDTIVRCCHHFGYSAQDIVHY